MKPLFVMLGIVLVAATIYVGSPFVTAWGIREAVRNGNSDYLARAWARVKRAEFTSLTSFEIDMEDKYDPTRLYLGKLELRSVGWKLTELRVKFLTTAKNAIQKLTGMEQGAL